MKQGGEERVAVGRKVSDGEMRRERVWKSCPGHDSWRGTKLLRPWLCRSPPPRVTSTMPCPMGSFLPTPSVAPDTLLTLFLKISFFLSSGWPPSLQLSFWILAYRFRGFPPLPLPFPAPSLNGCVFHDSEAGPLLSHSAHSPLLSWSIMAHLSMTLPSLWLTRLCWAPVLCIQPPKGHLDSMPGAPFFLYSFLSEWHQ